MKHITLFLLLSLMAVFPAPETADAQQQIRIDETVVEQRRVPVRLVDNTDNETEELGVVIAGAECQLSERGNAFNNCTGTVVEIGLGNYYYQPAAIEVDTAGFYVFRVKDTTVDHNIFTGWYQVMPKLIASDIAFRGVTTCEGTGCVGCAGATADTIGVASGDIDADNEIGIVGNLFAIYDLNGVMVGSSTILATTNTGDCVRTASNLATAHAVGFSYEIIPSGSSNAVLAGTQTFNNTGAWTGNITGNLSGSVGSVTGNVSGSVNSVTGSVGSVTGAVGSVTGSVGSIASGGLTSLVAAVWAATQAELAACPIATASMTAADKLTFVMQLFRHKMTETATARVLFKEDTTTPLCTSVVSDNGTTATLNEGT